jgi:hypothetical protein
MRRLIGLLSLLSLSAGCYDASFSDYQGKDAGHTDARADARDAARDAAGSSPVDSKKTADTGGSSGGKG